MRLLRSVVLYPLVWTFIVSPPLVRALFADGKKSNVLVQKSCLRLVDPEVVTIDPAKGSGEITLHLRNETSGQVSLALTGAVKTPPNSAVRIEFSSLTSRGATTVYEERLPPKQTVHVRLLVENVWDDGEFDVDISNHYGVEPTGKIHVRRPLVSIKPDGTDRLKLGLLNAFPTEIPLKNDDNTPYNVSWKLVNGEDVCGGQGAVLRAKASTLLECIPNLKWRVSRLLNLLKSDANHDGYRLVLSEDPITLTSSDVAYHPIKTFPAEATLDYYGSLPRAFGSYLFLILLLTAGGVSSLLLSYMLPNKILRLDLKDKLVALAGRTADLSTRIDSRLAVFVRLERNRLLDLLGSRNVLSLDFSTIAAQCTSGIDRLSAKVAALEQMDVVLGRLGRKLATGVPPTKVDEVNAFLEDAGVLLGKAESSEDDSKAASAKITTASALVDTIGEVDANFGQKLTDRVQQFRNALNAGLATSPTYSAVIAQLPGPEAVIRSIELSKPVSPDKYSEVDYALGKLELIRGLTLLQDGITNQEVKKRLNARQSQLVGYLEITNWQALRAARLLLREMQDDVYPERLLEALSTQGETSIGMDPSVAYERAPLEFYIYFHKSALNTAAARDEVSVEWDFGDGLSEKGWNVSHYFVLRSKPGRFLLASEIDTYVVKARFHDPDGSVVVDNRGEPITIEREVKIKQSEINHRVGERTKTELLKLGAALLIAVFGLVSGAQEQIAKLDILPGMVAVFLLGFSADSIKRLLTSTKS